MKTKSILLVEDSRDDVELMLRALRENKITNKIVVVEDGEEALECLIGTGNSEGITSTDLPAVVLLDLNLPKVDGLEVLRQIRENEQTKFLPVVILTSSNEDNDLINGYKLGCNSYIRKPVDFKNFAEAVKNIGLYWLLLNELPNELGEG